jgi:hypothetical protein
MRRRSSASAWQPWVSEHFGEHVRTVVVCFRQGEIVDTWREERSEAWCVGGPYDSPKYGPCVIVAISKSTSPPAVTVESVSSR